MVYMALVVMLPSRYGLGIVGIRVLYTVLTVDERKICNGLDKKVLILDILRATRV